MHLLGMDLRRCALVAASMGASAAVLAGCQGNTTVTTTKTITPSPQAGATQTSAPSTGQSGASASSSAAITALGNAGTAACKQRASSANDCTDFPNAQISMAYPLYGFSGPFTDSYGGGYFKRSSTTSADWTLVWAAGPGPYSCSGSFPISSAIIHDLGGCY